MNRRFSAPEADAIFASPRNRPIGVQTRLRPQWLGTGISLKVCYEFEIMQLLPRPYVKHDIISYTYYIVRILYLLHILGINVQSSVIIDRHHANSTKEYLCLNLYVEKSALREAFFRGV